MKRFTVVLLVALCGILAGCGNNKAVTRINVEDVRDLSGFWNDTDSRLVAEEMIKDSLERPWITDFMIAHAGKRPDVIVGKIRNKSYEHINTETFVLDLQRSITNSGRANFVASGEERQDVRSER